MLTKEMLLATIKLMDETGATYFDFEWDEDDYRTYLLDEKDNILAEVWKGEIVDNDEEEDDDED